MAYPDRSQSHTPPTSVLSLVTTTKSETAESGNSGGETRNRIETGGEGGGTVKSEGGREGVGMGELNGVKEEDTGTEEEVVVPENVSYEELWEKLSSLAAQRQDGADMRVLANQMVALGRSHGVDGVTVEIVLSWLMAKTNGTCDYVVSRLFASLVPRDRVPPRCIDLIIGRLHLQAVRTSVKALGLDWLVMVYDCLSLKGGARDLTMLLISHLKNEHLSGPIARLLYLVITRQHVTGWVVREIQSLATHNVYARALLRICHEFLPSLAPSTQPVEPSVLFAGLDAEFMVAFWSVQEKSLQVLATDHEIPTYPSSTSEPLYLKLQTESTPDCLHQATRWLQRDLYFLSVLANDPRYNPPPSIPMSLCLRLSSSYPAFREFICNYLCDVMGPDTLIGASSALRHVHWLLPFTPLSRYAAPKDTHTQQAVLSTNVLEPLCMAEETATIRQQVHILQSYTLTLCHWANQIPPHDTIRSYKSMHSIVLRIDHLAATALTAAPNDTVLQLAVVSCYTMLLALCSSGNIPFVVFPSESVLTFLALSTATEVADGACNIITTLADKMDSSTRDMIRFADLPVNADAMHSALTYFGWLLGGGMLQLLSGQEQEPIPREWPIAQNALVLAGRDSSCRHLSGFMSPTFHGLTTDFLKTTQGEAGKPTEPENEEDVCRCCLAAQHVVKRWAEFLSFIGARGLAGIHSMLYAYSEHMDRPMEESAT